MTEKIKTKKGKQQFWTSKTKKELVRFYL